MRADALARGNLIEDTRRSTLALHTRRRCEWEPVGSKFGQEYELWDNGSQFPAMSSCSVRRTSETTTLISPEIWQLRLPRLAPSPVRRPYKANTDGNANRLVSAVGRIGDDEAGSAGPLLHRDMTDHFRPKPDVQTALRVCVGTNCCSARIHVACVDRLAPRETGEPSLGKPLNCTNRREAGPSSLPFKKFIEWQLWTRFQNQVEETTPHTRSSSRI